jgi:hypothetical protein
VGVTQFHNLRSNETLSAREGLASGFAFKDWRRGRQGLRLISVKEKISDDSLLMEILLVDVVIKVSLPV